MKTFRYLVMVSVIAGVALLSMGAFSAPAVVGAGSAAATEAQAIPQKKVNVNTATADELKTIKGLGKKKAQAIIDYRNEHGNFKTVDEVSNVKGFGKKRLAKIASQLIVN